MSNQKIRTLTIIILQAAIIMTLAACSVIEQPKQNNGKQISRTEPQREISSEKKPGALSDKSQPSTTEFVTPSPATKDTHPDTPSKRPSASKTASSKKETITKSEPKEIIPSYEFTRLELEHVKFSNHNPFTDNNNTFILNLDTEKDKFTFPLDKNRFSSGYGMRGRSFHSGIDLLEEKDAPIYAAFDGVVRISKPYSGYGNIVVLRHSNGLETVYSHNNENLVKAGDFVRSGDKIALIGRTGTASANHLHFEVRILGQTFDPRILVDVENMTLQKGILEIRRNGQQIVASNNKSGIIDQPKPLQPEPEIAITTTNPPKQTAPPQSAIYHTIVKGDTLYSLSRKYGTSIPAICKLNNITEKTTLQLGKKLRIK